jgi:protein-S-isoprenylcysteine O-methyltransferase Ste14
MLNLKILVLATLGLSAYGSHSILMVRHDVLRIGRLSPFINGILWVSYFGYVGVVVYTAWKGYWLLPSTGGITVLGGLFLLVGVSLTGLGIFRAGILYEISGRATEGIVYDGVYGWSRNPQFVGWILMLTGLSVVTRSGLALLQVVLFAAMLHGYVVYVREPYLTQSVGNPFKTYRNRTPRYVGFPIRGIGN